MPIKYDSKVVAKIDQKSLIACAKTVKIKSPEKVAKEALISAFLETVEALAAKNVVMAGEVVQKYNEIVIALGLDQETTPEESTPEETTEETGEETIPEEAGEETTEETTLKIEAPPTPAPVKPMAKPVMAKPMPTASVKPTVPIGPRRPIPIKK